MNQSGPWQKAIHTGIHSFFLYEIGTKGDIDRGKGTKGGQLMEVKSMTEQEKRTLAEISVGIYGEELTRIMLPELKEYLNGSTKRAAFAEMIHHDQAKP